MFRRFSLYCIVSFIGGALMMTGIACSPEEAKKAHEDKRPSSEANGPPPGEKSPSG